MEKELEFINCSKCCRKVERNKFQIHDIKCKGEKYLQIGGKKAENKKQTQIIHQVEKFPCSFCAYQMTMQEFDTHPNQCLGKISQCEYCKITYPNSLLEEHHQVCPQNYGTRIQQQRQIFNRLFTLIRRASELERQTQQIQNRRNSHSQRFIDLGALIRLLIARQNLGESQGLEEEEIKKLKRIKYEKVGKDAELCTICYCNFEQKEQIISLKCKHLYHNECISKWLNEHHLCPVCKSDCRK